MIGEIKDPKNALTVAQATDDLVAVIRNEVQVMTEIRGRVAELNAAREQAQQALNTAVVEQEERNKQRDPVI